MNVRIGHRGDRWVELGAWHAVTGEARRFCDATGALLFLRERMTAGDIRALRGLLTRVSAASRPLDDAALLRLVAHCLHSRTLKAVVWHERRYGVTQQIEAWQAPRVELPAPAPRESAPVPELPIAPPPPRPAPVPELSDGEAQAIALRKAARSGVACCEICQQVQPPAPAEPALLADSDPDRQAEALREAARDGLPFCEVCQRTPSPAPPRPPPTARPVPAAPQPSPPPVDAMPADSDPVAQAETLRAAASEGTPFCAICQRAPAAS